MSAERSDRIWLFSVTDNGIEIRADFGMRIFDPFQRACYASQYEGVGPGLSTCRKIGERHEGTIWYESTPGDGTTFFFTLAKA